ncbi:MAG TPA: outer membrane lipid asymmetry maintenance protein MlaD [Gammaproteobacteria bacterium]|jgi:phospholipid/cholesterol/gamma-HCH transport system substrate-binding protein
MKQTRTIEIVTGAFIVLGFVALYIVATSATNIGAYGEGKGYTVSAEFNNIGGLKPRAAVTMAGVAIGRVTDIRLDPKSFNAQVIIQIDGRFNTIPDDSTASVLTAGLLGENYVGIDAGGSDKFLKQGSSIQYTQSALVLEKLIGQFFSKATEPGSK